MSGLSGGSSHQWLKELGAVLVQHGYTDGLPMWLSGKESAAVHETQEMWVGSLDQEDPLEKEMATHSSILAWEIPGTEEPGGLQSMGSQRARHDHS